VLHTQAKELEIAMDEHTTMRRMAIGVAAVAGAAGLYMALPASAEHVEPQLVEDNPGCDDVAPGTIELKVEDPSSGTSSDGTLTVNIDVFDTPDGQEFDWTSNIGVDAVIVKGGPDSNVYFYDPEATADTGLHAPEGPSGMWAGLSHISFCYDTEAPPPTTPSSTSTTSTTTTSTTTPPTTVPEAMPAPPVPGQPIFTG
jgi:hypothetical protein